MERSEIINKLNHLESSYKVEDWQINDIYIWPILKLYIFSQLFKRDFKEVGSEKIGKAKLFSRLIKSGIALATLFLKKKSVKKHVLFSGANNYRIAYNGHFVNRFFFPLYECAEESNVGYLTLDFDRKESGKIYSETSNLFFLKDYTYLPYLLRSVFKRKSSSKFLDSFEEFVADVNCTFNLNFDSKGLISVLSKKTIEIENYEYVYKLFISKFNVFLSFGICYYSTPMFALHHICNKMKITSIDFQHGAQGNQHIAYVGFYKHFKDELSLLPKAFWVWDQASADNLQKWSGINKKIVIKGGNTWVKYLLDNMDEIPYAPNKTKKVILYTMQFEFLDREIIECMKQTDDKVVWWLRLHPRKTHIIPDLEELLRREGIFDKVEIRRATELPLVEILSFTNVHISKFSGSIIEAEQCGVPSLIIDKIGNDIFEGYIKNGYSTYVEDLNADNLIRQINIAINLKETIGQDQVDLFDYEDSMQELLKN